MSFINPLTLDKREKCIDDGGTSKDITEPTGKILLECSEDSSSKNPCTAIDIGQMPTRPEDSGLFLYIDLHGHASKKGVFMYGNYFDDPDDTIMCMLLPKLLSINNPNFHFTSCNFAERNMYLMYALIYYNCKYIT